VIKTGEMNLPHNALSIIKLSFKLDSKTDTGYYIPDIGLVIDSPVSNDQYLVSPLSKLKRGLD